MRNKVSLIIIIILVLVLAGIGFFIFKTFTDKEHSSGNLNTSLEENKITPVLTLEKTFNTDYNYVVIKGRAETEDKLGIKEIIDPENVTIQGSSVEYIVRQNGTYEFKVNANNNETAVVSIEVTEIREASSINPYIPTGFSVLNDKIEEGYVIADEYGNQYVWVPVPSGSVIRDTALDLNYKEENTSSFALVNSVAKYYGFYIARFEASEYQIDADTVVAASMAGKVPWTSINCIDAINTSEKAADAFGYTDCKTALISSYAWDTTLKWIEEKIPGYKSSVTYGMNETGNVLPTGSNPKDKVNNICDLAGNVREWTTEMFDNRKQQKNAPNANMRIVRGGGAKLQTTPESHIAYAEDSINPYWGFRTILYKQ